MLVVEMKKREFMINDHSSNINNDGYVQKQRKVVQELRPRAI